MSFCTRFGRMIRKPKNEYTDRTYVKGSGFKGCDQYDRGYSSTSFVGTTTGDNNYVEDDFLTNDEDDLEIIDLSDEEPEAEMTDEEPEAEFSDEEPEAEFSDEEPEAELSDEEGDDDESVPPMTKHELVYTLNDEAGQNNEFFRVLFQQEYALSKQNDESDDDEAPEYLESA